MNILFLSVYEIQNSDSGYIYADLVREFAKNGHNVYAVTPTKKNTEFSVDRNDVCLIRVKNGQIQKTGKFQKIINLLTLESKTIRAVKKYAKGIQFDLVVNICSNLCFLKVMRYFRKKQCAKIYLLLKDIFPQNAVDLDMIQANGIMGIAYRYFRKKEKKMYRYADFIGCMSAANRDYILAHNNDIDQKKVTIVPNSIDPREVSITRDERLAIRDKYGIPQDKIVFVYGGNLGKPQGVPFIIECLKTQSKNDKVFFFIVGDGTDYVKFEVFLQETSQQNIKILRRLPRADFDNMLAACDIGMIFLDHKFTVPNYPSRLLSYLQAGLPVFACTDESTDIGKDIVRGSIGWWCESHDVNNFVQTMLRIEQTDRDGMLKLSKEYLQKHFTTKLSYDIIMRDTKV